ncbi:ABC transporter ATP-binding protein [Atopobium fossor]|uniref:ABC transporter ATP-binding protein n=1 Tax=Atopobium fossor TaxID=39487 RepID=UPI0003F97FE9|nr:ABC transporter ATP-binding protein [Atopobium fossor]
MKSSSDGAKQNTLGVLFELAGSRKPLIFVGCALSGISMLLSLAPFVFIWLVVRDLVMVAPNWQQATSISSYGWAAFAFSIASIVLYFIGLMCTHLAAFRIQTNMSKRGLEHLMHVPLGYFDNHSSGMLRRRIEGVARETETLIAHNLADITGTIVLFISMLILLFIFDWRMGCACLIAVAISIASMMSMMGGDRKSYLDRYQSALDNMGSAATEYLRGIPVVKVFQQTVYSFKAYKEAVENYSVWAQKYSVDVCRAPQSINLTFTEGAFIFLVPVAILLAPGALASGQFVNFVCDFAFYAIFSAIIATALAKIMFATGGMMQANEALRRYSQVMDTAQMPIAAHTTHPQDASVCFENVSFTYEGATHPALDSLSLTVEPGTTLALVGPSGGGKTTAASLVPRFWDVDKGRVLVGGVDVRDIDTHELMDNVAFVFQRSHLLKGSILENVLSARPNATHEQVLEALHAAQCDDILAKLPQGVDTVIGTSGTYLSGGEVQRILLAQAILKDAPIVVLDEATAFADPENEALIQQAFARLAQGKTVIMIAHRLSTVVSATKIAVLNEGKLQEQGTHQELIAAGGLYARMWNDYQNAATWKIERGEA